MTYTPTVIFDQIIEPGLIYTSSRFSNSRFLLIDTVDLPIFEALEMGLSVNILIPIIGRTISKNIPLLPDIIQSILDTFYVISIPAEIYESQYELEVVMGFSSNITSTRLRIYTFASDISEDFIRDSLLQIQESLNSIATLQEFDVAEDAAQIFNSIQNNLALGALSTAFSPLTAGTSLAAIPSLTQGTASLSLLLPGI